MAVRRRPAAKPTARRSRRTVTRPKASGLDLVTRMPREMTSQSAGWIGLFGRSFGGYVHEPFAGAWQRNIGYAAPELMAQSTVWACVTLIMSDIGKLAVNLIELADGIWQPTESAAFSPVLRQPNHYQNRIKFFEQWVCSKLTRGNTYALKERDERHVVTKLFILEPSRVEVLVAPDGSVYYQLAADNLAGLGQDVAVPASEMIHDVGTALYHPLCGLSPIMAAGLPAYQSLKIQQSSAKFFQNNSKPGGVLTAPHQISESTAQRIQAHWDANFAGEDNIGKVAVLGDGLKYEAMSVNAKDAELIEQLKWSDERICSVFHVPAFMVGVGTIPGDQTVEKLIGQYYAQCLQALIESIELCLDLGLALPAHYGIEFDVEGLFRMDAGTKIKISTEGVRGGVFAPNEARRRWWNLPPVPGGDSPMMQQQQWSLADLDKRRELGVKPKPLTPPTALDQPSEDPASEETKSLMVHAFRTTLLEKRAA